MLAAILAAAFLVAPLYLTLFRRELRRSDAIARSVRTLGLEFARTDDAYPGSLATRYPFELFSRGTRQECENVFRGTIAGLELVGFDLSFVEEPDARDAGGPPERSDQVPVRTTCVIADVGASFPHLVITPVGAVGGAFDAATWAAWGIRNRPIQFESRDFDRLFRVRSEDVRFASALVDPAMMDWLLSSGASWRWELQREYVLCTGGLVAPRDITAMVSAVVSFARHIPRVALSL